MGVKPDNRKVINGFQQASEQVVTTKTGGFSYDAYYWPLTFILTIPLFHFTLYYPRNPAFTQPVVPYFGLYTCT